MSETLRLRWEDVDWERQTLCIGADGMAKGKEPRLVNFNPQLKAHLLAMLESRASEAWLFPSAQRGNEGKYPITPAHWGRLLHEEKVPPPIRNGKSTVKTKGLRLKQPHSR